jgi:hypothetical protein
VLLSLARITVAATCAGLVMWTVLSSLLGTQTAALSVPLGRTLGCLSLALVSGGTSYAVLCALMGVREVQEVGQVAGRRLRRLLSRSTTRSISR